MHPDPALLHFGQRKTTYNGEHVIVPVPDYPYQPIDVSHGGIRLVHILPESDGDAGIKCTLTHANLDTAEYFTALSYVVGDPSQCETIYLDNHPFPVTINLYAALVELRSRRAPAVWIDAISIDQSNDDEKSRAIQNLYRLYHKADSVTLWLGPHAEGSDEVFRLLRAMELSRKPSKNEVRKPWTPDVSLLTSLEKSLAAFAARAYWTRVWMVQEISLGSRVVLFCGTDQVTWRAVQLLLDEFKKSEGAQREMWHKIQHMDDRRLDMIQGRNISLPEAIYDSRHLKATDMHDRIYAFLGMCFDRYNWVTRPHYGLSLRSMCIDMTETYIWSRKSLDIIFLGGESQHGKDSLPSWCADYLDWQDNSHIKHLMSYLTGRSEHCRNGRQTYRWNATSGSPVTRSLLNMGDQQLQTKGIYISKISSLGWAITDPDPILDPDPEPVADTEKRSKSKRHHIFRSSSSSTIARDDDVNYTHAFKLIWALNWAMTMHQSYQSSNPTDPRLPNVAGWMGLSRVTSFTDDEDSLFYDLLPETGPSTHVFQKSLANFSLGGKPLSDPFWRAAMRALVRERTQKLRADLPYMPLRLATAGITKGFKGMNAEMDVINKDLSETDNHLRAAVLNLGTILEDGLRLVASDRDHVGWVSRHAKVGDEFWLLNGCSMVAVLRPVGGMRVQEDKGGTTGVGDFKVIGYALLSGVMDGEVWDATVEEDMIDVSLV